MVFLCLIVCLCESCSLQQTLRTVRCHFIINNMYTGGGGMISGQRESSFTLLEKTNTYGSQINFESGTDILKPEGCFACLFGPERKERFGCVQKAEVPPDKIHLRCLNRDKGICCILLPSMMQFCFASFQNRCSSSNIYHAEFTVIFSFKYLCSDVITTVDGLAFV